MNNKNLIIGKTSQLSHYFPAEYDKISSRNINFDEIIKQKYNRIIFLFAEQRTFLNEDENFFKEINFHYTLKAVDRLKDHCDNIVLFSTAELWNNYDGEVSVNDAYNYNYTPYIKSKEILCNHINEYKENYKNIIILHPFNFNSPKRKEGFLFYKIFDSIINRKKNVVGDLDFTRDIIHGSIIAKHTIEENKDAILGSGELINIENFVKDLFYLNNLNYKDYLEFDVKNNLKNKRKNYKSKVKLSKYSELLKLTNYDIQKNITS